MPFDLLLGTTERHSSFPSKSWLAWKPDSACSANGSWFASNTNNAITRTWLKADVNVVVMESAILTIVNDEADKGRFWDSVYNAPSVKPRHQEIEGTICSLVRRGKQLSDTIPQVNSPVICNRIYNVKVDFQLEGRQASKLKAPL